MDRKEFRAYFDKDPCDSHASFDRRGFADIGCPWPTTTTAKKLAQYPKVKSLCIGIHREHFPVESLATLFSAWAENLEYLDLQDFRHSVPRSKRCRVLRECCPELENLAALQHLKLTNVAVNKPVVEAIACMPALHRLTLYRVDLTLSAFRQLERSNSLKDIYVGSATGVYAEDKDSLSVAFRKKCRVAIMK